MLRVRNKGHRLGKVPVIVDARIVLHSGRNCCCLIIRLLFQELLFQRRLWVWVMSCQLNAFVVFVCLFGSVKIASQVQVVISTRLIHFILLINDLTRTYRLAGLQLDLQLFQVLDKTVIGTYLNKLIITIFLLDLTSQYA